MTAPATAPSTLAEAVSEAAERFSTENPESRARFERATQYLPGGDTRTVNYYAPFRNEYYQAMVNFQRRQESQDGYNTY